MKVSLILLPILLATLAVSAQPRSKDSLYFVHLNDGSTIYSRKIDLVNSGWKGKYLLLDSNRRVPLGQASDFKGWEGAYAVGFLNGQFDVYKLENEGRRISLYSQCYYTSETVYASTTPNGPSFPTTITTREKSLFFRKDDSAIQRLTFKNLKIAVADNAASMRELRIAGTNLYVGVGLLAAGVGLVVGGIIQTHQRNTDAQNAYSAASRAWVTQNNPNAPMPTLPHYGLSPLFWVGTVTTFSALIPLATVGRHAHKAILIYNGLD